MHIYANVFYRNQTKTWASVSSTKIYPILHTNNTSLAAQTVQLRLRDICFHRDSRDLVDFSWRIRLVNFMVEQHQTDLSSFSVSFTSFWQPRSSGRNNQNGNVVHYQQPGHYPQDLRYICAIATFISRKNRVSPNSEFCPNLTETSVTTKTYR